jgi:hypothetical protein
MKSLPISSMPSAESSIVDSEAKKGIAHRKFKLLEDHYVSQIGLDIRDRSNEFDVYTE